MKLEAITMNLKGDSKHQDPRLNCNYLMLGTLAQIQ